MSSYKNKSEFFIPNLIKIALRLILLILVYPYLELNDNSSLNFKKPRIMFFKK